MDSLVSICIPTYNGQKYLQKALDSVNRQTYKNIEVVISDDNSIDETLKIIEAFRSEARFPVLIHAHQPQGIGANWNNCIEKSNGSHIKFLFQDDILADDCVEKMMSFIENNSLEFVVCKRKVINENDVVINSGKWYDKYGDLQKQIGLVFEDFYIFKKKDLKRLKDLTYNFVGEPPSFLFSKKLFFKVGRFNQEAGQILDLEYAIRALEFFPIGIINGKLFSFRIHDNQMSKENRGKKLAEYDYLDNYIKKKFFRYLAPNFQKEYIMKKINWFRSLFNNI